MKGVPLDWLRTVRPDRIHLVCPGCGRRLGNSPRRKYDPPHAAVFAVYCGRDQRCGKGGWIDGGRYYDASGYEIDSFAHLEAKQESRDGTEAQTQARG